MKQGVLPFQYEQEKSSPGMTAMAGMMTYLELMHAAGLRSSVERHVGLRECGQGWTDSQVVSSLILLNLAGGESVVDLDVLEKDAGLCRVLREVESYGMGRRERRALEERWRVERRRSMPSESAVFRYLERFHEAGEESSREAHRAFIPSPNEALGGLHKVNADMVSFVQSRSPCAQATLDMDATLVETHKQQALYSYKKYKPGFPILGVFRLKGQPKRDGSIIVRSCKASQSPVYPIRDAILAVNHASCPSLSSSGPCQWGESVLKTRRLPGALSLLARSWLYPPSAWRRR